MQETFTHRQRTQVLPAQPERHFYAIAGSVMLALTLGGFRSFILKGKGFGGEEMTGRILPLVVTHGLAMFGWMALFLAQSLLISSGNRRLHMQLGRIGTVLAGAIVVLGPATAVLSVHFNPAIYESLGGAGYFLAIMLSEMFCFGAFVALGLFYRRRAEIHRPMMLLASVVITSGSLARFPYTSDLSALPPLYSLGAALILAALFYLLQWALSRAANRWFAAGLGGLLAASVLTSAIGYSEAWKHLTGMIIP